jgi:2'-5' RNA ligase
MEKPSFTITLNFFVPDEVVENLKAVNVSGRATFDWRKPGFAHCTVKAIWHGTDIPDEKVIETWSRESRRILSKKRPFEVLVKGVTKWPTVLVSLVNSKEVHTIHNKLLKLLPSSQPQFDGKNFTPHVSIAVGKSVMGVAETDKLFGKFKVNELQLMLWGLRDLKNPKVLCVYALKK